MENKGGPFLSSRTRQQQSMRLAGRPEGKNKQEKQPAFFAAEERRGTELKDAAACSPLPRLSPLLESLGGGSSLSLSLSLSLRFPLFFHTQVRTLFSDTGGVLTFSFRNLGSLIFFLSNEPSPSSCFIKIRRET